MSVEAAKWTWALRELGFAVRTVAGEGEGLDVQIRGRGRADGTPSARAVEEAIGDVDLVVVENLLSLPLNPSAAGVVSSVLRGRPSVLRHHDLAWQRPMFAGSGYEVPDDRHWAHVVINSPSAEELAGRGIDAMVLHNRFPVDGWRVAPAPPRDGRVLLHPVRAIARKDVATALRLAEALDATYWLTGPAEDGYEDELASLLREATCTVRMGLAVTAAEAYAACDAVAFPSLLEGFGNPVIESAFARRPLSVRRYPVLVADLEPYGFRWFDPEDPAPLAAFLDDPDRGLLDHNESIARSNFGLDRLPGELSAVLERVL